MKKLIFTSCLFFLFASLTWAQQPQEILGIAKEKKSKEYYQEQSDLWKKETLKDKKNGYAWWQYYKAQRAFFQLSFPNVWANNQNEIFGKLKPLIADAKKSMGNSFEYNLMESYNTRGPSSIEFAKKAYSIDPNRVEVYGSLLLYYAMNFQDQQAGEIAQKMLQKNHYSNANLKWNLNALLTIAPGGVFISNGDLDAFPKWVLQYGNGIRKDVVMISKWMLATNAAYRKKVFDKIGLAEFDKKMEDFSNASEYVDHLVVYIMKNCSKPVYVNVGTSVDFFRLMDLEDHIYLVGVAFVYSKQNIDNQAIMVNNFENNYHLDYLLDNFQTHPENEVMKQEVNLTYLPGLFKMKEHFQKEKNQEKENYYDSLIQQIAKDSGRAKEVLSWFK